MERGSAQHQYILQLFPFTQHLRASNGSGLPAIEMVTNSFFFSGWEKKVSSGRLFVFFFYTGSIKQAAQNDNRAIKSVTETQNLCLNEFQIRLFVGNVH